MTPESLEIRRSLVAAADAFRTLKPWEWMTEADLFGVMDPENGHIGYCSVLGSSAGMYGLDVVLGTQGLDVLLDLLESPPDTNPEEFGLEWKSLRCSYENKRALVKEDRELLKQLSIKYSSLRSWPLFRSFEPTLVPWFVTDAEARFLALCLEQAALVCNRHREDPSKLVQPMDQNKYFCRVPQKNAQGLAWSDQWLEPAPLPERKPVQLKLDDGRVRRISLMPHTDGEWEADYFSLPDPIDKKNGERPFYPYLLIVGDKRSGKCLGQEVMPNAGFEQALAERLISIMENAESRPGMLCLHEEADWSFLEPAISRMSLAVERKEFLPTVEEIYAFLEDNLDTLNYP